MNIKRHKLPPPPITAALAELQGLIRGRYPEATFSTFEGDDPEGFYLRAVVDVEDMNDVLDVVIDRLLEMQIDEDLDVYVVPGLPQHRIEERLRELKANLVDSASVGREGNLSEAD